MTGLLIGLGIACATGIVHTYLVYPAWLARKARNRSLPTDVWPADGPQPRVFLLFAAYNEVDIIREKLDATFATDYPMDRLTVWVGSDGSDDGTDEIVQGFEARHDNLQLFRYNERAGKAVVLNKLMEDLHARHTIGPDDVLVFTDANILFERDTLHQLVQHFKRPEVGQVGANILNRGMDIEGISAQEQFYISHENTVKYHEGVNWGCMMGAFGACYAMRATLYPVIPRNFLMEDFYISLSILQRGHQAILEPEARCWEDLPKEVEEEFKRKTRISAGNFQNLSVYWPLLLTPWRPVGFAFLSHKVLRWITPLLLATLWACSGLLRGLSPWIEGAFWAQTALLLTPFIDRIARSLGVHFRLLRFAGYFYSMNAALVMGFVKYVKGVRTNVWKPTKRTTA